jgi:hypothetical protein
LGAGEGEESIGEEGSSNGSGATSNGGEGARAGTSKRARSEVSISDKELFFLSLPFES